MEVLKLTSSEWNKVMEAMSTSEWKEKKRKVVREFASSLTIKEACDLVKEYEESIVCHAKVRDDLTVGERYGGVDWCSLMEHELGGKTVPVILKFFDNYSQTTIYAVQGDMTAWFLSPEMIEMEV